MIHLSGLSIVLHQKPKIFKVLTIFTFDDIMVLVTSNESGNYSFSLTDSLPKQKKNQSKMSKIALTRPLIIEGLQM